MGVVYGGNSARPAREEQAREAARMEHLGHTSPKAPPEEPRIIPLEELTVARLREVAVERGLTGVGKLKKADLIAAIRAGG